MRPLLFWVGALAAFVLIPAPPAHALDASRSDAHAPIGVMGEHTHAAGEWMLSYRAMYMDMHGNRDGTSGRSAADVIAEGFPVTPTQMRMQMHMLGGMYAPTDDWTLMAMVPFVRLDMDHVTGMGAAFTTSSEGIGDVKVSALYRLLHGQHSQVHLNLGVGLPTGATSERDWTPMGRVRLPYPMQLGSGTFDLMPGVTGLWQGESYSGGAQAIATLRTGESRHDYTLGNRLEASTWGARRLTTNLSASLRLTGLVWGNISGADRGLARIVPTADPNKRAGRRLDAGIGFNWLFDQPWLAGQRLAIEGSVPVYQSLDGPQLETDWTLVVGWQKAF